jgi:hypothetical protein
VGKSRKARIMKAEIAATAPQMTQAGLPSWTRWVSRLFLTPLTVVLFGVGLRLIAAPARAAADMGIAITTPSGLVDMRVVGTFPLAVALIGLWCLLSERRLLPGLWIASFADALALGVRAVGVSVDREAFAGREPKLLIVEAVLLAVMLAGIAIESARRRRAGVAS